MADPKTATPSLVLPRPWQEAEMSAVTPRMDRPHMVDTTRQCRRPACWRKRVSGEAEPARRALLPLQRHQAPLTQRLQRLGHGGRVYSETVADLTGADVRAHQAVAPRVGRRGRPPPGSPHASEPLAPAAAGGSRPTARPHGSPNRGRRLDPGSSWPGSRARSRATPAKSRYSRCKHRHSEIRSGAK